jgi:hypothetical protein
MDTGAKLGATVVFIFGILAALGTGLWSLYVFKRVSSSAGTMLGYWLTVADDGERLEALEATMKAQMDGAVGSRASYFFGLRERGGVSPRLRLGGLGNVITRKVRQASGDGSERLG